VAFVGKASTHRIFTVASETFYPKVGKADRGENIQDDAKNKHECDSKL